MKREAEMQLRKVECQLIGLGLGRKMPDDGVKNCVDFNNQHKKILRFFVNFRDRKSNV